MKQITNNIQLIELLITIYEQYTVAYFSSSYSNHSGLGTWKLYIKAGRQAWEAFIPVYNAVDFNENY